MQPVLFSGRSHPDLGRALAAALGIEPGRCLVEEFADGEIGIAVQQEVASREVLVLQSTGAPGGRNLLELLLLADASRRRGAHRVTALIPYFGYARQDRRVKRQEAIGARLLTDLLACRFDRIVTVDLHNPAIEGFASVPLLHLSAVPLLAEAFVRHRRENQVLVAPDAGAVKLAQRYGELLRLPVAYLDKLRKSDRQVVVQAVAGEVRNRAPVLVDDMISTGGTMVAAAEALLAAGATRDISILVSHCLLAGEAAERLARLPLRRLVTTDSVAFAGGSGLPIESRSLAGLLAASLGQPACD